MPVYTLDFTQKIPAPLETVWDFISSPKNLKRITPESMGFDIVTPDLPEKMYPGIVIAYDVRPLPGIRLRWVSEITQVEPMRYFIDDQRIGPYKLWHHQHHVEAITGGVKMRDIVHYQPPLGWLGGLANALFIRRQLEGIFTFRNRKLVEIFGPWQTDSQ